MLFWIAFLATFLSAACYSAGSVLQQVGTHHAKAMTSLNPRGVIAFFGQVPYIVGLVFDAIGFSLFLFASHVMPLFFVQPVQAFGIVVTVIIARLYLKKKLARLEYYLIFGILLGLIMISFTAAPEIALPAPALVKTIVVAAPVFLIALAVGLTKVLRQKPMLAAFMAGLSLSGVAIASRMITGPYDLDSLILNPLVIAIAVYAALGLTLFSLALQNGLVTHVDAAIYVAEIIVPTAVGLTILGDNPRPGTAPLLYSGLVIVIVCIAGLALTHRSPVPPATNNTAHV